MENFNLTIYERVQLYNIIPENTDFQSALILEDVKEKVQYSKADLKKVNWRVDDKTGKVNWDEEKDEGFEVEFSTAELEKIREVFKNMSKNKQIIVTRPFLKLYQKFHLTEE